MLRQSSPHSISISKLRRGVRYVWVKLMLKLSMLFPLVTRISFPYLTSLYFPCAGKVAKSRSNAAFENKYCIKTPQALSPGKSALPATSLLKIPRTTTTDSKMPPYPLLHHCLCGKSTARIAKRGYCQDCQCFALTLSSFTHGSLQVRRSVPDSGRLQQSLGSKSILNILDGCTTSVMIAPPVNKSERPSRREHKTQ